ncbi:hypothetical protein BTHERMOSOX_1866 [Bathymodiolus thermophilus thioautotrophic gill symbiont]|nr:hypothetical protein BTHERMOSOX_1866 [Bathymodiolus thermophilus thioautotrophic gill symbiont]
MHAPNKSTDTRTKIEVMFCFVCIVIVFLLNNSRQFLHKN